MRKDNLATVILAAGKSTRMNSSFSKVLHKIYGKSMLEYILDAVQSVGIHRIYIVANSANSISEKIPVPKGTRFIFQNKLLGTGHALKQTTKAFKGFNGDILVLYGDIPLLKVEVLKNLIDKHTASNAVCTILTTTVNDPTGYGRIIRDEKNDVARIVEEEEASLYEKMISEINVGVYCFNAKYVFKALNYIRPKGHKSEYYLTDVVQVFSGWKLSVESYHIEDTKQTIGVNTRMDLANAQLLAKERILGQLMSEGVGIIDPMTTHIYNDVEIGKDTIIYPFTVIESNVVIGKRCRIGPFARIRPECVVDDEVEIGNYVEIVRTKVGYGTKIRHRCFIADALIGKQVNIESEVTTANIDEGGDGKQIVIRDGVVIGAGAILVPPLELKKGTRVGIGTVVSKDSTYLREYKT